MNVRPEPETPSDVPEADAFEQRKPLLPEADLVEQAMAPSFDDEEDHPDAREETIWEKVRRWQEKIPAMGMKKFRTGVNDHAWEREHKYPTRAQQLAMGYRRRAAEAKPGQHLEEARRKSEEEQDTGAQVVSR